jgi:CheY-like chemotaxis protein
MNILLVDDNPGDARLMQEVLSEGGFDIRLSVAADGVEALDLLRGETAFSDPGLPDLILLDLNMPCKDGRELLADLKQDEELRRIPVIVLTTSTAEEDVLGCYDLHANCYITKPVDLDHFLSVIRFIVGYWIDIVTLPSRIVQRV